MNTATRTILIIVLVLVIIGIALFQPSDTAEAPDITYTNANSDLITVAAPQPGATIQRPVTVSGEARGTWYFEATFPIVITDWDGRIIGEGFATAQDNWMTEEFVPFEATVQFTQPDTEMSTRGAVILQRANASGLPEHDAVVEIPIQFEE